jgi:hypothetical protein
MLELDLSAFERRARDLGGAIDQVPFALSRALNDALFKAKDELVGHTWPSSITVRNPSFIRAALNVEPSTKTNLRGAVFDRFDRGNLRLHDRGGTKQARGRLAIPDAKIKGARGAKGLPKRLRPAGLARSFRKGDAIYQRVGKYQAGKKATKRKAATAGVDNRKLQLMFTLKRSANMRADVPFTEDFRRVVIREVHASFPTRLRQAMGTRRG